MPRCSARSQSPKPVERVELRSALLHQLDEHLDHRREDLVVSGLGEQHVERGRDAERRVDVRAARLRSCSASAASIRCRSSSVRRCAARRVTSTSTISLASMYSRVTPRSSAVVRTECGGASTSLDRASAAMNAPWPCRIVEDAEDGESVQRLADRRTADAEVLGELALRGNLRPRREVAERLHQLLGNGLGELAARCRLERNLGCRPFHRLDASGRADDLTTCHGARAEA